ELSPEHVEGLAVQAPRGPLEAGRVDEVRRADLGHPHGQLRVAADDGARGAGMVEMDVREKQVADFPERGAAFTEPFLEAVERRRWSAVEEKRAARAVEHVDADRALCTQEPQVNGEQRIHNP